MGEVLNKLFEYLAENQEDIPEECVEVLEDLFWELLA